VQYLLAIAEELRQKTKAELKSLGYIVKRKIKEFKNIFKMVWSLKLRDSEIKGDHVYIND